jgi:hypothetical protein
MVDDPLDSVYSIVERTYIRLQAGDILNRCLEGEIIRANPRHGRRTRIGWS